MGVGHPLKAGEGPAFTVYSGEIQGGEKARGITDASPASQLPLSLSLVRGLPSSGSRFSLSSEIFLSKQIALILVRLEDFCVDKLIALPAAGPGLAKEVEDSIAVAGIESSAVDVAEHTEVSIGDGFKRSAVDRFERFTVDECEPLSVDTFRLSSVNFECRSINDGESDGMCVPSITTREWNVCFLVESGMDDGKAEIPCKGSSTGDRVEVISASEGLVDETLCCC